MHQDHLQKDFNFSYKITLLNQIVVFFFFFDEVNKSYRINVYILNLIEYKFTVIKYFIEYLIHQTK